REVVEQVADRRDAGLRGGIGELWADSVERLDRDGQDAGTRPVDGRLPQLRAAELALPGEGAGYYWAASSHHQLGWPPSGVATWTRPGRWVSISERGIGAPSPAITVTISAPLARC